MKENAIDQIPSIPVEADVRREYLREDIQPIQTCIGTAEDWPEEEMARLEEKKSQAMEVKWSRNPVALDKEGFKHDGHLTYVLSPVNEKDKTSEDFGPCIGIVVVGVDKETKKNISSMFHAQPYASLRSPAIKNHMAERYAELKERCEPGTIDVGYFGGWGHATADDLRKFEVEEKEYENMIKLCNDTCERVLGLSLIPLANTKHMWQYDTAFFDNEHRRLYIERSKARAAEDIDFNEPGVSYPQSANE